MAFELRMNLDLLEDSVVLACRGVYSFQNRYMAVGRLTRTAMREKMASTDRTIVQAMKLINRSGSDLFVCQGGSGGGGDLDAVDGTTTVRKLSNWRCSGRGT